MANKFKGNWKLKGMHQHAGSNMFLGDVSSITVNTYATRNFSFKFKIGGSDQTVTMTEGSSDDSFSGAFSVGSAAYEVAAYKYSYQSKVFVVGLIGTPGLGVITPTDVISFTAVKTD